MTDRIYQLNILHLFAHMHHIMKGINASEITGLPDDFVPSFTDKLMWIKPTTRYGT